MGTIAEQHIRLTDGRTVTLRHGVPADAAACIAYVRQVLTESDHFSLSPDEFTYTEEQETQWLKTNLENPNSIIIVAALESEVIGLLDFRPNARRKNRHFGSFGISVRQAFHGRGIGTAMMHMLLDWARANPTIEMISLEVYSTNTRAIELYKRLGFVESGRLPRCHKMAPGSYADDVQMYLTTKYPAPGTGVRGLC